MWGAFLPILVIAIIIFLVVVLWSPSEKEGFEEENLALSGQPCALSATSFVPSETMGKPRPFNTILLSSAPVAVQESVKAAADPKPSEVVASLPTEFDSRKKWPGLISGPLDQAQCGSCWAFSTATAISDRFRISTRDKELQQRVCITLSNGTKIDRHNNIAPWIFASCDFCDYSKQMNPTLSSFLRGSEGTCSNEVCQGGMIGEAYQYMRDIGGVSMVCNGNIEEYSCKEKPGCKKFRPDIVYPVIDPTSSDSAEVQMMKDIFLYGPLTIGYMVYSGFEQFFASPDAAKKVFSSTSPLGQPMGGHAVDIIGWGTSAEGVKFWLVRNSWGPYWADGGYFRIQRGINFCGFEDPTEVWGCGVKKTTGFSPRPTMSIPRGIVVNPTAKTAASQMQQVREQAMLASMRTTNWVAQPPQPTHEVVSVLGSTEGSVAAFDAQQAAFGRTPEQQMQAIQDTWGSFGEAMEASQHQETPQRYELLSALGSTEGSYGAFLKQQAAFGRTPEQQMQAIQDTWGCHQ
ncbi:papain-like cysteine peptidase [Marseillevirus Shanghai 1]|nr:papain-like cysteine peptidase [Marseillevirus Shanghai 1]